MNKSLSFEISPNGVGCITFDRPGEKVNTFSQPVLAELDLLLQELAGRKDLKGLLLRSGKPGQFIAGADLKELGALAYAPPEMIQQVVAFGHALMSRMENLPFPTVALIDGACMGGGTELVLSMDYRLASKSNQTKIGLPEVKVGLIPGWGGTQRLPRLCGLSAAVEMVTTGEPVDTAKACDMDLIFDAVPLEKLFEEGTRLIEYASTSGDWLKVRQKKSQPLGLTEDQLNYAFSLAEQQVLGQTKGQYPAPMAALKAMRDGVNLPLDKGLQVEQACAMSIFGTPTAANLIAIFFHTTRLGRDTGVDNRDVKPLPIESVGVMGAGLMGAGIAAALARSDIHAAMVDVDQTRVNLGLKSAQDVVESRIQAGRATHQDLTRMLTRLNATTSKQILADCDLVIEAVTENEDLKKNIYQQLAALCDDGTIVASNTSTISITRLAKSWRNPAEFVGIHFFNPVDRMALVEVIRGEQTSDQTVATAVALVRKIRKTPIVIKDCPGFLVNRILLPYMSESLALLQEGAEMDRIDKVATRWGMPMGPIALHDLVGLDTCLFAGNVLRAAYSDRATMPEVLEAMVKAKRLGKKSGGGFKAYDAKGRPQADPAAQALIGQFIASPRKIEDREIEDRLFLVMLLEAVRAWEEKIVRDPGDVDMGMILGTGFPAFRGGPLRWCDNESARSVVERVKAYEKLGRRFSIPPMLQEMAASGGTFYPRPKAVNVTGVKA